MPLNFKDDQNMPPSDQGPILHQPGEVKKGISKFIIILFVIVVVAAGAYLVYTVLKRNTSQQVTIAEPTEKPFTSNPEITSGANRQQQASDTTQTMRDSLGGIQPATDTTVKRGNQEQISDSDMSGSYTLYISRHKTKEVADSEAKKWNEAGYETTVTELDGWYRLSIGKYKTWDEAKAVAEKLRDGLEGGYRIGKIEE